MNPLSQQLISHWKQLGGMTYDFLESIIDRDLGSKLPFDESQSVGYQIYCMTGTQETFTDYIKTGVWGKWTCSFDNIKDINKEKMIERMREDDQKLIDVLSSINPLEENTEGKEKSPLQRYLVLVEHESHHQGQIINLIYANNLPIPKNWKDKWNLSR